MKIIKYFSSDMRSPPTLIKGPPQLQSGYCPYSDLPCKKVKNCKNGHQIYNDDSTIAKNYFLYSSKIFTTFC